MRSKKMSYQKMDAINLRYKDWLRSSDFLPGWFIEGCEKECKEYLSLISKVMSGCNEDYRLSRKQIFDITMHYFNWTLNRNKISLDEKIARYFEVKKQEAFELIEVLKGIHAIILLEE